MKRKYPPAMFPDDGMRARPLLRSKGSEVPIGMFTVMLPMRICSYLGMPITKAVITLPWIVRPHRVDQKLGGKNEAAEGIDLSRVLTEQDLR